MAKTFRDWDIEQLMMFPPSVEDFVPSGHLAHFVRDTVSEALDLSAILDCYNEDRGYPPYHPVMMTAVLPLRVLSRHLPVEADCEGLPGAGGFHGGHLHADARLSHDQRFSQAAFGSSGGVVRTSFAAVSASGVGEAGARGSGWDQGESQRL